jgi:uncharacterized protein (TIGR03382 family)
VAVRALGPTGHSIDAASDGVSTFDDGPQTGEPGGCCDTGGGAPIGSISFGAIVVLALRRRRRGTC